ncbi:response regulator transcription factor [Amylibacter sp.]|nr:response regulator transcription factor [Amylibacter sp.]MDA9242444.1 response regulator transcription factor [Amylibacter sp.]MDC1288587.1 response regulator transcription factor [Amylibacter sp.]
MQRTSSNKSLILIVEDEPSQMELLSFNLNAEGYDVLKAEDGEEGLLLFKEHDIDLVLLDWMLPNISGLEVCRQMKRSKNSKDCHLIMLTARGEEEDKVRGLDMGADDYIVKPYSVKELLARVRSGIRIRSATKGADTLNYGKIKMEINRRSVKVDNKVISIGPLEFKLLQVLLESPKRVFSRSQLLEKIWTENLEVETRTVDVHIGRLRKAIKSVSDDELVKTVRGFGYSLDDST